MNDVSFPLAFLAGVLSFLSPCVLPLVPAYVSVIKTSNGSTKMRGIQALEGFHSVAGLAQLVHVLNEGSESLNDAGVFEALSKATAS